MKLIAVLLNLLRYFYYEIQGDKTYSFVHGEALKVWTLKYTQNLVRKFNLHQFSSVCHQSCAFDKRVIFCKLLDRKY